MGVVNDLGNMQEAVKEIIYQMSNHPDASYADRTHAGKDLVDYPESVVIAMTLAVYELGSIVVETLSPAQVVSAVDLLDHLDTMGFKVCRKEI